MVVKPFFDNIRGEIIQQIEQATDSIYVAVAWFTDKKLFDILLQKLEQQCILVHIILSEDALNFNEKGLPWDIFLEKGGGLYVIEPHSGLLHHKFAIVDSTTLITGSYNWTYKAAFKNRENVLVINEELVVDKYLEEFDYLCRKAKSLQEGMVYSLDFSGMNPVEKKYIEEEQSAEQQLKEEVDSTAQALYLNGFMEAFYQNRTIEQESEAEPELEVQEDLLDAEDLYEQGLRFHNNMEYEKAILQFEQALRINPEWDLLLDATVWSYLRLCEQQFYNKNQFVTKALTLLEANESFFEAKGIYYNTMGCIYDEARDYGKAISFFKKALSIEESNIYYWNLRKTYKSSKSESNVEKIETILHRINANYIKANEKRQVNGDIQLMEAYFQRAFLYNIYKGQDDLVLRYVIKAKKAFNALDELDKDMHKYQEIKSIVSKLPKAMQKEFKNA